MRLIDLDELRKAFRVAETCDKCSRDGYMCDHEPFYSAREICGILDDAPTVDAAPRRFAHWKEDKYRERHWRCSNCQRVEGISCMTMHYCPFCGAEMAEHPYVASMRTGV